LLVTEELLSQALNSAKYKAEIITKNMGITPGKVITVNESFQKVGERTECQSY